MQRTATNRIPSVRIAYGAIAALLAALFIFGGQRTHAQESPFPVGLEDAEQIFVQQTFRDDGRTRNVTCPLGSFSDVDGNAALVWDFFIAQGYSEEQVAGIIGNMTHESGVQPQRLQSVFDRLVPAENVAAEAVNVVARDPNIPDISKVGWGLVQWTPFTKYISTEPRISDANHPLNQVIFLHKQLEGIVSPGSLDDRAGDNLRGVTATGLEGVREATFIFARDYERAAAQHLTDAAINRDRLPHAEAAYAKFTGRASSSDLSGGVATCEVLEDATVVEIAIDQHQKGGASFFAELPDGNAPEFVSWVYRQAGLPFTDGEDGWRFSSVQALMDFFINAGSPYSFVQAGNPPQAGDVAIFYDPARNIEYTAIVIEVLAGEMVIIGVENSSVTRRTVSYELGVEGLVGFGRVATINPGGGGSLEALNNPAGMSFDCNGVSTETMTSAELDALATGKYGAFHSDCFTEITSNPENGAHVQGQFRLICTVSHFSYDDPIIFPGQAGRSHLHMFWGNTRANAATNFRTGDAGNLLESGGSTCQGGPLNRSAYWAPAMLAGHGDDQQIVMPKKITLYYKSHKPSIINELPQGIQLLIGNVSAGGVVRSSFENTFELAWGCYDPGLGMSVNNTNTIPGTNGTAQCPNGWDIQATIAFPQCLQELPSGGPVLTSGDFLSHTTTVRPEQDCPSSHPHRVPQISYLIRWANPEGDGESNWRLSSDTGFDQPSVANPGGSLHGDWLGGWYEPAIEAWIEGCFRPTSYNCSLGQTGQNGTNRQFKRITGTYLNGNQDYTGPQLLTIPGAGSGDAPAPNAGTIFSLNFDNAALGGYTWAEFEAEAEGNNGGSVQWVSGSDSNHQIVNDNGNNVLRKTVAGGTCCNGAHGTQFRYNFGTDYDTLYFAYRVKTDPGFEPVLGGKLPGLCGGTCNGGGAIPTGRDGWSARNMWRSGGALVQYMYYLDQSSTFGEDFNYSSSTLGSSWQTIEHKITMNTPSQSNGRVEAWVNGSKQLDRSNLRLRLIGSFGIDSLLFSHFYGGSTAEWAPNSTQQFYFDDFVVSTDPITH